MISITEDIVEKFFHPLRVLFPETQNLDLLAFDRDLSFNQD